MSTKPLSEAAERLLTRLQSGNLTVRGFGQEPTPAAKKAFRELVRAGKAMSIGSAGIEVWKVAALPGAP